MADLGPVAWPPAPIRTKRLVLREPEAVDRAARVELLTSPELGSMFLPKLGFTEAGRFEARGAGQWYGIWFKPGPPPAQDRQASPR